ncbi:MAG: phosphatidylserine/phosphatidylglycerophosphate/cardiolipin synthase family protein [Rhodobacter sp.]|uniref:phospholipase D-like domain-containing protein n=1 Tax=Pararhodobacter sp. TaxID=2127056 RepID=UPI001DEA3EA3|nr:phosphatidylserine/phosphatidylglycerophosphate/cardiolipin synthase family protein [Pararhodobacter sp.]MCB1343720.1 phosphatidylserine/phosphatidylglycerophosphate/cardiolipin synthase family protein [Paracoccaceae bacterium]MCC0074509.1 phosphatidylserine/phosphatidylglycerophosphate/cardiolipin synthase family protein [Rhodobacter sp.]HPD91877.1 phosphatidylserine/phosphatidylglycerophosphate/cardiolipin synthase family protein [Pararhodobacter sp.]
MSGWPLWLALALALAGTLALAALFAAGRFAKLRRGAPSRALAPAGDTTLDALLDGPEAAHPGLSGARLVPAETEALALRLAMARLAERSLDLLYYIWDDDLSGRLLAQAVLDAADRGVRVRMLLDDVNVLNHDPVYRALDRHPRIELRLFNPIRRRDRGLLRGLEMVLTLLPYNRRMHGKLWITDGRLAMTGGRNVGDAYFGALAGQGRGVDYDDLDALLAGPVLRQAEAHFDRFWNSDVALPIRTLWPGKRTRLKRFRTRLARFLRSPETRARLEVLALPSMQAADTVLALDRLRWTGSLAFLGDPPEKALGTGRADWLPEALLPLLQSAERELRIMTPYFVPGVQGLRALIALQRRGVQVHVVTNGLALADNLLVYGAYRWYRARLLAEGVRIFEVSTYQGPDRMLHSKAFVVDGARAFVGSFNFDLRSAFLNTELGITFADPVLVADLEAIFNDLTRPACAWEVGLDGTRPQWSRGAAERTHLEPQSTTARRAISWLIGHLPIHRFL